MPRSGGTLVRRKVSFGNNSSMGELLADLKAQAAQSERDEAIKKADKTQAWNDAVDKLKSQAQQVVDGTLTAPEYKAAVDSTAKDFSEKKGILDANLNSVLKSADTQRYNEYLSGAMSFDSWKGYAAGRKSDGAGAAGIQLLTDRAQKNEDTVNYNKYIKGDGSYQDWQKYVASRQTQGGNLTDLQTLSAQASHNEDRANDRRAQISYNSGAMNGSDYQTYLNHRISGATDPADLTALKTEKTAVARNEFTKTVNDVVEQESSGRIDKGTAALMLQGLLPTTQDQALRSHVLNQISAYTKSAGSNAGQALREKQSAIKADIGNAITDFNKAIGGTDGAGGVRGQSLKPGTDMGGIRNTVNSAYDAAVSQLTALSKAGQGLDTSHADAFLATAEARRSSLLRELTVNQASAIKVSAIKTGNPFADEARAASLLANGSKMSELLPQDSQSLFIQGYTTYQKAVLNHSTSLEYTNAQNFVNNRVQDVQDALKDPKSGPQLAASLGLSGQGASQQEIAGVVNGLIRSNSGAFYKAMADAQVPNYQGSKKDAQGNVVPTSLGAGEFHNRDQFSQAADTAVQQLNGLHGLGSTFFNAAGDAWAHQDPKMYPPALLQQMGAEALRSGVADPFSPFASDPNRTASNLAEAAAGRTGSLGAGASQENPSQAPDAQDRNAPIGTAPATPEPQHGAFGSIGDAIGGAVGSIAQGVGQSVRDAYGPQLDAAGKFMEGGTLGGPNGGFTANADARMTPSGNGANGSLPDSNVNAQQDAASQVSAQSPDAQDRNNGLQTPTPVDMAPLTLQDTQRDAGMVMPSVTPMSAVVQPEPVDQPPMDSYSDGGTGGGVGGGGGGSNS